MSFNTEYKGRLSDFKQRLDDRLQALRENNRVYSNSIQTLRTREQVQSRQEVQSPIRQQIYDKFRQLSPRSNTSTYESRDFLKQRRVASPLAQYNKNPDTFFNEIYHGGSPRRVENFSQRYNLGSAGKSSLESMLKIEDILKMQDILKNFEQHENTITPSYAQELVKLAQIIQSKISY